MKETLSKLVGQEVDVLCIGATSLRGAVLRFRHAAVFLRWRPDKRPAECRYDQLEVTPPAELAEIFRRPLRQQP